MDNTTLSSNQTVLISYIDIPDWFYQANKIFNYVLTVLQFIGLTINIIHLSILTRPQLRSISIYRLMIGICSCDIFTHIFTFLCFSPFLIRWPPSTGEECFSTLSYKDAFFDLYGIIVLDSTQRSSTWLALLMALYRTLSVSFPMSGRIQKMSKPSMALWTILIVTIVSIGWAWEVMSRKVITPRAIDIDCDGNIVDLMETRYVVVAPRELEQAHNTVISIYGFIKALPSLIDPILTVFLVIQLRKAAKRRKKIGQSGKESDNTTKLVLFMTISFFILEVPNGFSHIVAGLFHNNRKLLTISLSIAGVAEILPAINSSSHIFICLLMSSQYRETAKSLYWKETKQETIFVQHHTEIDTQKITN